MADWATVATMMATRGNAHVVVRVELFVEGGYRARVVDASAGLGNADDYAVYDTDDYADAMATAGAMLAHSITAGE